MFRACALLVTAAALACCSGHPTALAPTSSPVPPWTHGTIPARGSDCQYRLLGLFPLDASPNTQKALSDAKEDADVDVLTDITVDENRGYYILFSNHCVRVQGMGVRRGAIRETF